MGEASEKARMEEYERRIMTLTDEVSLGIPLDQIGRGNLEGVHPLENSICYFAPHCEKAKDGETFITYCEANGEACPEKHRRESYRDRNRGGETTH